MPLQKKIKSQGKLDTEIQNVPSDLESSNEHNEKGEEDDSVVSVANNIRLMPI